MSRLPHRFVAVSLLLLVAVLIAILWRGRAPGKPDASVAADAVAPVAGQAVEGTDPVTAAQQTSAAANAPERTQVRAWPELAGFTYARGWLGPQPTALAAFRDWAESFRGASEAERATMEARGVILARERRTVMRTLIEKDPERALQATVPAVLRAILPSAVLAEVEARASGVGDYVLIPIEPNADGSPPTRPGVDHFVWLGGQSFTAHTYGRRTDQLTQENASLHGIALDGHMALHKSPLRVLEPGEMPSQPVEPRDPITGTPVASLDPDDSLLVEAHGRTWMVSPPENILLLADELDAAEDLPGPKVPALLGSAGEGGPIVAEAAATSWTTGLKKVLVIRVDFSDLPGEPKYRPTGNAFTVQDWQNLFENQVAPFYAANSYGAATVQCTVTDTVYRMPETAEYYAVSGRTDLMQEHALSAAASMNPGTYDVVAVAFSWIGPGVIQGSSFTWAGQGMLGGSAFWLNGYLDLRVFAHELGHNYGLAHADLWHVTDGNPISPQGTVVTYGDTFDIMGGSAGDPTHHFNECFKNQLGWLPDNRVLNVTTSGTFRLHRFDVAVPVDGEPLALRIRRGSGRDYWLGYRQPNPYSTPLQDGLFALWKKLGIGNTRSLDLSPTTNHYDVALPVGSELEDALFNISFRCVGTGGSGSDAFVDVAVEIGQSPAPPVSIWGGQYSVRDVPESVYSMAIESITLGARSMLLRRRDGTIFGWEDDSVYPIPNGLNSVRKIVANRGLNAAIRENGELVTWGTAPDWFLSVPPEAMDVRDLAIGDFHALALRTNGTVVGWGHDVYGDESGQISGPTNEDHVVGVAAGGSASFVLKADGTVAGFGPYYASIPVGLTDVVAVSSDGSHTLALKRDGTVVGWGAPYIDARIVPVGLNNVRSVLAVYRRSMALTMDGQVVIWGTSEQGDPNAEVCIVPDDLRPAIAIAGGPDTSAALHGTGAPAITVQPWSRTINAGETAKFTTLAVATGAQTSRWQRQRQGSSSWIDLDDGGPYSGSTTETLQVSGVTAALSGENYRCVVTGTIAPAATSESVSLLVGGALIGIGTPPANTTAHAHQSVTFNVVPYGEAPFSFEWRKDGDEIPGAISASVTLTNVSSVDAGYYTVTVSNAHGSVTSSPASLVVGGPPVFTNQPLNRIGIVGQNVSLSATATGVPTPTYTWQKDGSLVGGANSGTLSFSPITLGDAGEFIAVASNVYGNTESEPARLMVFASESNGKLQWEDIGAPSNGGEQGYASAGERFGVRAGGVDMWGSWDQFRFGHHTVEGDGELIMLVEDINGPNSWSRIGLSVRGSLAADAAHVSLIATVGNGTDLQWRSAAGGATAHLTSQPGVNPTPVFLKLVRAGNVFTGYRSDDGTTWIMVGSVTVAMPATVHAGIIASAVSTTGAVTGEVSGYSSTFDDPKSPATVALGGLERVFDGSPKAATVAIIPAGLSVLVTYDGSATAPTNVGSYALVATVTDANYTGSASGTLTIAKAAQSISFAALSDQIYSAPALALNATASSGLPVTFAVVSGPATVSGSTLTLAGAGTVTVRASRAGDGNHLAAAPVDRTFTIAAATATITLASLSHTYDGAAKSASASTTPAGLVTAITYDGSATAPTNVGSYAVVATVTDSNYTGSASGTLTIVKAAQSISFAVLSDQIYSAPALALNATASSGLPVTFAVVSGPATVSGSTLTLAGAGTVIVRASQGGDAIHLPAAPVDRMFNVAAATATITLASLSHTYDGAAKSASASTTPAGLATAITYDGSAIAPTNAGSYAVVATVTDANYTGSASGTLTIAKAAQSISFAALGDQIYGAPALALSATASSGLPVTFAVVSGPATVSGSTLTLAGAGTVTVRASQAGDGNHLAAAPVDRTFTIAAAAATITLANLSHTYDGAAKSASASTTPAGLATAITYNGSTIAPTNAGSYAVVATVTDANYTGSASGTLTIAKAAQSISFAVLSDQIYGASALTLSATASSALPVTFAVVSGPATVSGSTLTLTGTGTVTVRASQGGDAIHLPAAPVDRMFNVAAATATITLANLSHTHDGTPKAATATTNPPGLAVELTYNGSAAAPSSIGAYTVVAVVTHPDFSGTTTSTLTIEPAGNAGTYFGQLSSGTGAVTLAGPTSNAGAVWGLTVAPDGSGTFIAWRPTEATAIVAAITVRPDGEFSAVTRPMTGATAASMSADRLVFEKDITVTGRITAGVVSGQITGWGLSFSGVIDGSGGPGQGLPGLYTASVVNESEGSAHALVGPSGYTIMVVAAAGMVDGGSSSLDAAGKLAFSLRSGGTLTATIDPAAGTFTGGIATSGAQASLSFMGLAASVAPVNRIVNLSTRGFVGGQGDVMIAGFVVSGTGLRPVLVRAIGPTLAGPDFGVAGAMPDPQLEVKRQSDGQRIAVNDDWSTNANLPAILDAITQTGAFPVSPASKDAMLLLNLPAGAYTAIVSGGVAGSGIAIAEVYSVDDSAAATTRVVNISTRGFVAPGDNIMIPGFVTAGNAPRRLLIRAIGPALAAHEVAGFMADPVLRVFDASGQEMAVNDDWEAGDRGDVITAIESQVGAFPLPPGSKDAALLFNVPPGTSYTIQIFGKAGATGVVLAEVYEVP